MRFQISFDSWVPATAKTVKQLGNKARTYAVIPNNFTSKLSFNLYILVLHKSDISNLIYPNSKYFNEKCQFSVEIQKNLNLVGCDRALLICLIIRFNYPNFWIKNKYCKKSCQIVAVKCDFSVNHRLFTSFSTEFKKSRLRCCFESWRGSPA